jgi:hypothetical protein
MVLQDALSPVVDRPDRRISSKRRVSAFLYRRRFGRLGGIRSLGQEWLSAQLANVREWTTFSPRIGRIWTGVRGIQTTTSVAVYIHYSPSNRVSEMVLRQLREYRSHGFSIIFVSTCDRLEFDEVHRVQMVANFVVHRRNYALDFGAWHDVIPFLLRKLDIPIQELLLVNDSVCGPLNSMAGAFERLRKAGDGLFGLTENLAPQPHIQSYFLLTRGEAAISDLMLFVERMRLTAYKRAIIRRGEIRLSSWMRQRGHLVAVLNGYELVEWVALQRPRARHRLSILYPDAPAGSASEEWFQMLQCLPANPTHAFWRELVESCGFPFIKTELLTKNLMRLPDVGDWPQLVSPDLRQVIEDHIANYASASALLTLV